MSTIEHFLPEKQKLEKISRPLRVLGIDLGTTNSAAAQIIFDPKNSDNLNVECLTIVQNTEAGDITLQTVPSVVAVKDNRVYVGEGAKRMIPRIADKRFVKGKNIFYECKNEIGTKRLYHNAPEGFRTPAEISGKILEFIYNSVREYSDINVENTVVTVPASFHPAQRMDTVTAAGYGGIFSIDKADLLDEPLASFICYIMNEGGEVIESLKSKKNFLIFDFGGGTCDVSIVETGKHVKGESLKMVYKSVSRYHRLGGSDIDRSVIYDVLIPQFMSQNNIEPNGLSYPEKKLFLEPALTGIAEYLKKGISGEIAKLKKFGKYENSDKNLIRKIYNSEINIELSGKSYVFKSPQITAADFEQLMEGFLSTELLYPRETEYKLINSIFSPLQDALERCNLNPEDVDFVLLTGGSSYIPVVNERLKKYFSRAKFLEFENEEGLLTSIAIGAAYQSLFKVLNGKGVVEQVNHYSISINTQQGPEELIPSGVPLPYPPDGGYEKNYSLKIPETPENYPYELRIEIADTHNKTVLYSNLWKIYSEVYKGEKITCEYRMNENGIIEMKLLLNANISETITCEIENPLLNTVQPDTKRIKIEEIEHIIKTEKPDTERKTYLSLQLANLYSEINYTEKAMELYSRLLRITQGKMIEPFNKLADLCCRMKDYDKMEIYYKEGYEKLKWSGFMFNLALKLNVLGINDRAENFIDEAAENDPSGPYFVLKAQILEALGRKEESQIALGKAGEYFNSVDFMDDWELSWYINYCHMRNDKEMLRDAERERKKRHGSVSVKEDISDRPLPGK